MKRLCFDRPKAITGLLLVLLMIGCQREPDSIDLRYGLSSRAAQSLNSTSLFIQKIRDAGHSVTLKRRITPNITDYDTIIWIPDDESAPSGEVLDALENWAESYYEDRLLIYVGRDYDGEADYFRAIADATSGPEKEEVLRRIAEKKAQDLDRGFESWTYETQDCRWFTTERELPQKSNKLSGRLVSGLAKSEYPDLYYSLLIQPEEDYQSYTSYSSQSWQTDVLLEVDNHPFVTAMSTDTYGSSRLIFVSNACFLLNFGLIDPKKEALADRLLDELPHSANVLVLESGPMGLPVSDSNYENHNSWAWISEAPLRYIIPHFLLWGVVYCFVLFPIFGRPKDAPSESTTSFRKHIDAVAEQLIRSGESQKAREIIRHYQNVGDDRGKRS